MSLTCGRCSGKRDWEQYRAVNQRFADAVVAEARSDDPIVLVQDYHFALLPAMIRSALPAATILTFWHIPWPNPESFGICPWRREILEGLLGSTILGFHTRFHCKNFLETADRYLEARIEHEHSTISFRESETLVATLPDLDRVADRAGAGCLAVRRGLPRRGAARASGSRRASSWRSASTGSTTPRASSSASTRWSGCSRSTRTGSADSRWCRWRRRPAARSTSTSSFQERIERVAERINGRFGRPGCLPVMLVAEHHEHEALTGLYRAADVCLVTSLHDGMNLVSKEFVAARDDEQGVLILSRFAGAARELTEALVVNPYHVEECADALHAGPDHARRRAARADAQPAQHGPRVQRVSLGRPDAFRCRGGCASGSGSRPACFVTAQLNDAAAFMEAEARRRVGRAPSPARRRCRGRTSPPTAGRHDRFAPSAREVGRGGTRLRR